LVAIVAALAGCRGTPEASDVEMEVRRVVVDDVARAPVVLLEDKQQTMTLPIWIGVAEAQAIALEMEGIQSPRPLTHDLLKQLLERLEVEFERAVITELREGTYYARIHLRHGGSLLDVDSRPSDAIALAVRFRKPVFVARAVLQQSRAVAGKADAATTEIGGLTVQQLSPDLAEHFGLGPAAGVLVTDVARDAHPGVQRGDVIVAVDGESVGNVADLRARLDAHAGPAELSIQRGTAEIEVTFDVRVHDGGN
jgi:bifunctional DNase/RNase